MKRAVLFVVVCLLSTFVMGGVVYAGSGPDPCKIYWMEPCPCECDSCTFVPWEDPEASSIIWQSGANVFISVILDKLGITQPPKYEAYEPERRTEEKRPVAVTSRRKAN